MATVKPDVIHVNGVAMGFEEVVYFGVGGIAGGLYEWLFQNDAWLVLAVEGEAYDGVGVFGEKLVVGKLTMNEAVQAGG